MADLSPAEKRAGRWFRDTLAIPAMEAKLNAVSEAVPVPPYLRHIRHECKAHPGHTTWAVELREYYVLSPATDVTPEGFFCWLWKGGSCSCGYSVRSGTGRMVVRDERPPLRGATEVRLDSP